MIESLSIIIPTYCMKDLILSCLKTYERFCPDDLMLNYIIVENSSDESYKADIIALINKGKNSIVWVNNETKFGGRGDVSTGAEANAHGLEVGLKYSHDEWVFITHADTCVTHHSFYRSLLDKAEEGNMVVGVSYTNNGEKNYCHISGYLSKTEILSKINLYPNRKDNGEVIWDAGDYASIYCLVNDMKLYCFKNTFDFPELIDTLPDHLKRLDVDRCVNEEGDVMFMHLNRGTPKMLDKNFHKPFYPVKYEEWLKFCDEIIK